MSDPESWFCSEPGCNRDATEGLPAPQGLVRLCPFHLYEREPAPEPKRFDVKIPAAKNVVVGPQRRDRPETPDEPCQTCGERSVYVIHEWRPGLDVTGHFCQGCFDMRGDEWRIQC